MKDDRHKTLDQNLSVTNAPIIEVKTSKSFEHGAHQNTEYSASESNVQYAGEHLIVDFWQAKHLSDINIIEKALTDAAEVAGATLLHIHIHQFTQCGGVTGVALLAESHISVHTWPERNYAAFDIFMCGDAQTVKALEHLVGVFKPESKEVKELLRGEFD